MGGERHSQKDLRDIARETTTAAETWKDISATLNNLPMNERVAVAKQMEEMNRKDRLKDDSLPKLEIDLGHKPQGDSHSGAELRNIQTVEVPGTRWEHRTDIYDTAAEKADKEARSQAHARGLNALFTAMRVAGNDPTVGH